jgi:hypothetical protein
MTPAERAQWCRDQADELKAGLPPIENPDDLQPIGYAMASVLRGLAAAIPQGD